MSGRNSHPCPATQVAGQLAGITAVLAMGAADAHMRGVAAARQARENYNSHVLYAQVEEAVQNAQDWAEYAKKLIAETEQLKAENERLRTVSRQRQAMIDHLQGKRIAA